MIGRGLSHSPNSEADPSSERTLRLQTLPGAATPNSIAGVTLIAGKKSWLGSSMRAAAAAAATEIDLAVCLNKS